MATSSQEMAAEIVRRLRQNSAEMFPGFHKIEEIERIAYEMVGVLAQSELIIEQRDAVHTSVGTPRIIELYAYLGKRSLDSLIGFFRIDVSGNKEVSKDTCHNHYTEEQIQAEILRGLMRVLPWAKTFHNTVATALLSAVDVEQEASIRKVAQLFGIIGTIHSSRTGLIIEGDFDYSNRDLPVAFSQLTGQPIDNIVTGIVRVHHDLWGDAIVSAIEAGILLEFRWTVEATHKG